MSKRRKRPVVVPASDYQPTQAELEEHTILNPEGVPFEQTVQTLFQPVKINKDREPRKRRGKE